MRVCVMLMAVTIGEALRAARGAITQKVVAAAIDVEQGTISRWESDDTRPTLEQLTAFEQATDRPKGFCLIAAGYVEVPTSVPEAAAMDSSLEHDWRDMVLQSYALAVTKSATDRESKLPTKSKDRKS